MKCLEFKRLALSDPNSKDTGFIEHCSGCPDCLRYVTNVRQMDSDLDSSLGIDMPGALIARLQLQMEMTESELEMAEAAKRTKSRVLFGVAASVVFALFAVSFLLTNQLTVNKHIGDDYESLLVGVVQHMEEQPITPVWESGRANSMVNTLLVNYDTGLRLKPMNTLQFGRICPMGDYKGLHASLKTIDGQATFAFIKGDSLGDVLDVAYQGYVTRVKPVRGGNLLIFSQNQKSLERADSALQAAMYWDV